MQGHGSAHTATLEKARGVAGVSDVKLDLVWDPPWSPSMMSEAARLELNFE
jgi:metal-sulfur cluster biosynthetic enzyme